MFKEGKSNKIIEKIWKNIPDGIDIKADFELTSQEISSWDL